MDWIDIDQWRALVNTAMNLPVLENTGKFLSICATGGFLLGSTGCAVVTTVGIEGLSDVNMLRPTTVEVFHVEVNELIRIGYAYFTWLRYRVLL
jgi:hypothetical protein